MPAAGPYRRDTPALAVGDRVGPYVLQTRLRSDPMSEAHVALRGASTVRLTLARPVDDPDVALRSLARMQQLVRRLTDAADILEIHDLGVVDGRVWAATAVPGGQPLMAWARERPSRSVLAAVRAVGGALAAAHRVGLAHTGLTPDDISVDRWSRVSVDYVRAFLDGLTALNEQGSFTLIDDPRETAWYEAPELWSGCPRDESSDQYTLCAVAWRALHDRHAFTGETALERVQNVFAGAVQPPPNLALPPGPHAALVRGLAPRPRDRWPSLAALLEALA